MPVYLSICLSMYNILGKDTKEEKSSLLHTCSPTNSVQGFSFLHIFCKLVQPLWKTVW